MLMIDVHALHLPFASIPPALPLRTRQLVLQIRCHGFRSAMKLASTTIGQEGTPIQYTNPLDLRLISSLRTCASE